MIINKICEICEKLCGKRIDFDEDLVNTWLLDSFQIMELISQLEDFYGIRFTVEEISKIENFSSVNKIVETVERKIKF